MDWELHTHRELLISFVQVSFMMFSFTFKLVVNFKYDLPHDRPLVKPLDYYDFIYNFNLNELKIYFDIYLAKYLPTPT